jgi:hypothetical protein
MLLAVWRSIASAIFITQSPRNGALSFLGCSVPLSVPSFALRALNELPGRIYFTAYGRCGLSC